jgi:hypothetical protein
MSNKITLEFDAADWKAVRWVINSFQWAIHKSYVEGSVRRNEADILADKLHSQARFQVNKIKGEEYDT